MSQISLFNPPISVRFKEFHEQNPHVYELLVKLTLELKAAGHTKIGIGMLFEVIRWKTMLRTTDPDFRLNNNYRSRYARMIMEDYPMLEGIFETRELRS